MRIESKEWIKGYKGVQSHGFVALANLTSKSLAQAAFAQMDDNGVSEFALTLVTILVPGPVLVWLCVCWSLLTTTR